jgi:hypothetical protein
MNEEVLYNKLCIQKMVQMLLGSSDSEMDKCAFAALEEAKKAGVLIS